MTIHEVSFKLQHECPFNELSRRHPELVVSHWCNYSKDVLEITYDDFAVFQDLQRELDGIASSLGVKVIRKSFTGKNVQLVVQHCGCVRIPVEISSIIERHNCFELQPTLYREGWEWYRILAFSVGDIKALFADLGKSCRVEVLSRRAAQEGSVRENFLISTNNLFGKLTQKQVKALLLALDNGYYRIPKKMKTEEIAKLLDMPRTTYEEHLRKAESKVLRSLEPYIQLRPR